MRHILVAVDLDGQAPAALAIARLVAGPDARIRVVHAYHSTHLAAGLGGQSQSRGKEASLELLRRAAGAIPGAEHRQIEGPPARAILDEARAWRADTIVVAPRSKGAMERFLMGSVSTEILRNAKADVLVARPTAQPLRSVLVCTDLHEPSRRAAAAAARLARRTGASPTLLFVADPVFWGADATAPWPDEVYDLNAEWLDRAHQAAVHEWLRARVREFNVRHFGGAAIPLVKEGMPTDVIVQEARRHDLVVLGTHGRTFYGRTVVGSVAEHVAAQASTSVLVVKN